MEDKDRSREQLFNELSKLRQYIAELEKLRARQKQAEEALRENEARYRAMFSYMRSGVAVYQTVDDGENFVFKDFNAAAERISRISRDQVIGKNLLSLFPNMDKFGLFAALQRVYRTGQSEHLPAAYYKDRVRKGWRDNFIYKLPSGDVVAIYEDVTEQKRAEEELKKHRDLLEQLVAERTIKLQESNKKYQNLVENALVGVYQTSLKGDILYANNTCLHMFGFETLEEVKLTGSPARYRNQEDRKTVLEILKKTGKLSNFEVEFLTKTGESVVVILSAALESDVITGMIMDITDRKRADEALKESESKHRLLAENVSDVIWTMDMNLNFTYISPSVARLRGITADQAIHQSLREVLAPSSYDVVLNVFEEGLAREDAEQKDLFRSRVLELEHIHKDGSIGWVEVKVSFLRDASGRPKGILGVTRDITHRKEAERELRMKSLSLEEVNTALKVLLEQREKDKNELEDKILFNVRKLVLPYVDALKQRQLDEEQRTYLDVLETNLKNIISPFAKKLTSIYEKITPAEIRVADFIRNGKTVKEIATTFGVSESAINLHRQHIRNKLGLNNQKINLRTYLLSLT